MTASVLHHAAAATLCLLVVPTAVPAEDLLWATSAGSADLQPSGADAALNWRRETGKPTSLIHVRIARKLLAPLFEQKVTRYTKVHDQILDSLVIGSSKTEGEIRMEMVPSSQHAVFDVIFTGKSVAKAHGTNEWVVAPTQTHTTLAARTRIIYDGQTLLAHPSRGQARSQVNVLRVIPRPAGLFRRQVPHRFIERAGWRQVRRTLALREKIVAQLSVARLQRFLDRELAAEMAKIEFPGHLLTALQNVGLSPGHLKVSSTSQALHLDVQLPETTAITALGALPVLQSDADIVVSVHQSAVDRLGHRLLSGAILDQTGLSRDGRQLLASQPLPAQLQLTMDHQQPIGIRFADGLLDLTLKSSHCELVETPMPGFGLQVRCRLQPTETGLRTQLVGPPRVTPSGPQNWSLAMIPLKQMVERALASQLSDRILTKSVLQIERLGQPGLRPTYSNSANGWLTLAWTRPPAAPVEALLADQAKP
ncbi:MAG: hypothetical protein GTO53_08030 [Planctomycetales bacterium]|nr:hypothetical protein [Planctomycetales bacterium]NIM09082.1 hypothetical protein [Planctomycetales bacterium]NIN08540.1 hypothetical protein [Planctomycetales bacterium]NIN77674.1 hypothetical protein [Planctomycetales bacterium]NIO34840.1 hypothetical protein [Planctomycetales bacterium]